MEITEALEVLKPTKELEKRLAAHLPSSLKVLSTVQLAQRLEIPGLKILRPKQRREDSLVLVVSLDCEAEETHDITAFCGDTDDEKEELRQLLSSHVDWRARHLFGGIPQRISPMVAQLAREKGNVLADNDCQVYYLPSREALPKLSDNPAVEISPLRAEHIPTVMRHWKFASAWSAERMRMMVEGGFCLGVFLKKDGRLASWMCTMRYGGLGILFTPEEQRGRGYSKLAIAATCRRLLDINIVPYVYIEAYNDLSKSIFNKMGFVLAENAAWIHYEPKK